MSKTLAMQNVFKVVHSSILNYGYGNYGNVEMYVMMMNKLFIVTKINRKCSLFILTFY